MKKILSALALGAVAVGFATADMSIGINYRNGIDVFKYVNNGYDGRTLDKYGNMYDDSGYNNNGATYNLFNLTGWNSGKDSVSLNASGNIFSLKSTLQPTIASDSIIFHIMEIGAEYGNFVAKVGWNGDGQMNYRNSKDNGNTEGKVWETYKLGGAFSSTDGLCSNNRLGFGATARNFYIYGGYSLIFNDKANMQIQATAISDRYWDDPSTAKRDDNIGWSVFLQPKVKGVFDAEVFAKGYKDTADKHTLIFGAYGRPLFTPLIGDGGIGGSVRLYDGKLEEWNVDVRLWFEISDALTLTSNNKFAKLEKNAKHEDTYTDGDTVGALAGLNAFRSSQVLWNMLGVRYKINKTFTFVGSVGQLTDFDKGKNDGRESGDGMQLYVYPSVQIFANGKISVQAGALAAFNGIGAAEEANKDVDMLFNIPVLLRVRL